MMQEIKPAVALAVRATAPTAPDDGTELEAGTFRHSKYLVTTTLAGATTLEVVIWLLVLGVWGVASDMGDADGLLGGAALNSGKVNHFVLVDLGVATRIALVKGTEVGGTVTASATIALVRERN